MMKLAFFLFAVPFGVVSAYECNEYSSCDECADMAGCLWVPRVGKCLSDEEAAAGKHPVITSGLECECAAVKSCGECIEQAAYCAWCRKKDGLGEWSSECVGTADENEERCTAGYYRDADECPYKKALLGKAKETVRVFA
uniref:PSI domain-containing protein n=1 Tax=Chromera velia CCMP2878 TaxID=1169474 RepID=A0A0G4HBM6_9ALVE|mmetsp:Transcript_49810/g.98178  ORF Transcript_49810/g.98178 Transcript_49810/m.98178 type:complete len:140 (-) Transcript_49810:638-1057(-)|eukprot:Cvel_25989.t1-p1 / transcript=Cvel_25989.t1 / gene=Cvel_25989 / organism=Chromera_velia_CCMP2878 / gene_product=hypothetical protein / transcript_product=hypothetical protein / location=Cvel_scaffold3021:9073-10628(+) / protein_length=139 / sequence_SO=supercontig / SO=protein_coding / is_pseudo=false